MMNKKILLLLLTITCTSLLMPDFAFAQTNESDWNTYEIINQLVRFFAWFRVIPATVAGKLMTNEFAFGEIIGLNTYLWKIRNIMRNFANFFIGALFLYFIFKTIYDGSIRASLQRIFKLLIAALLVNMSWFFMTVIVDFSTVATAAVSSLPVQVLEKTWERDHIKNIEICPEYNVEEGALNSIENFCGEKQLVKLSLETILPHADNMSGPIIYMGVGLLGFLSSDYISVGLSKIETIALTELIKILVLLMFIVPILLLVVTNMIRIFWIWIWIIFSPFIIIDMALGADSPIKKLREEGLLRTGEHLGSMLGLIFLPTVIVGLMGIGLVLMTNVMGVIAGTTNSDDRGITLEQLQISGNPPSIDAGPVSTTITGSVFDNAKRRTLGFFGEIILAFMSIFIFRGILKVGFSFSSITKGITNKAFELGGGLAKSIPIVPMFGGQSINSLNMDRKGKMKAITGLNKLDERKADDVSRIMEKFAPGTKDRTIGASQLTRLSNKIKNSGGRTTSWNDVKESLPTNGVRYRGEIDQLTKEWFGDRTVGQLRSSIHSDVFRSIGADVKLEELERSHGSRLAGFIQGLINRESGSALAAASNTPTSQSLETIVFT